MSRANAGPHLSTFDALLEASNLPPPGPSYYNARRALWLTPRTPHIPKEEPSAARQRLEALLGLPNAVTDEAVWKRAENVWKGLSSGGKLRKPLPMSIVVKLIHAAWLRDPDTWPPGAVAPDSDQPPPPPPPAEDAGYASGTSSQLTVAVVQS